MANRTKFTPKKRERFLQLLRQSPNVTAASDAIGISRERMYRLRGKQATLRKAWDAAVEVGLTAVEEEVLRRGKDGWDEPLAYQGVLTGAKIRRFSDTLLMFYLKAKRPEFRDKTTTELTGPNGGPLTTVSITTDDPLEAGRQYQRMISGAGK